MSTGLIDQQAVIDIATLVEQRAIEDDLARRVRAVIPDLAEIAAQERDRRALAAMLDAWDDPIVVNR